MLVGVTRVRLIYAEPTPRSGCSFELMRGSGVRKLWACQKARGNFLGLRHLLQEVGAVHVLGSCTWVVFDRRSSDLNPRVPSSFDSRLPNEDVSLLPYHAHLRGINN